MHSQPARLSFASALLAFVMALMFAVTPARAAGKFDNVGTFTGDNTRIELSLFSDDSDPDEKIGVIIVRSGDDDSNSFGCDPDEWKQFVELFEKARGMMDSDDWQEAGVMVETEVDDISRMTVSASRDGLRFVISSPKAGTVTHILAADDIDRFAEAVNKINETLAASK